MAEQASHLRIGRVMRDFPADEAHFSTNLLSGRATTLRQRQPTRACSMIPAENVNRMSGTRLHFWARCECCPLPAGLDIGRIRHRINFLYFLSTSLQRRHLTAWPAVSEFSPGKRHPTSMTAPEMAAMPQKWWTWHEGAMGRRGKHDHNVLAHLSIEG